MQAEDIRMDRLAIIFPRPCRKCGQKFLKVPGWRASGPDAKGFNGRGFRFVCTACCPTADSAQEFFMEPATWA
jgi:hypothetical protein